MKVATTKSFQRLVLSSAVLMCTFLSFYILFPPHQPHPVPATSSDFNRQSADLSQAHKNVQSYNEFTAIASNELFIKQWAQMEGDDALTWTKRIRLYAKLFTFWESELNVASVRGHHHDLHALHNTLYGTMSIINHKMFPWFKAFQSNPLALKKSYIGRGIVISVGNGQADFAYTSLRHIRYLGCDLPIEVFYDGAGDLSDENIKRLKRIPNLTVINLHDFIDDEVGQVSGWALKPFSILISSFEEAILMDADVVWMDNPEVLFDEPLYQKTGTLFYKDRTLFGQTHMKDWIKSFIPPPYSDNLHKSRVWNGQSSHEAESGVVVYNKKRRFLGILATTIINVSKLRDYFYKNVHGDKETFWIGPEMAMEPYSVTGVPAGLIGPKPSADLPLKTCSPQLLHFKENGEPLWFNQWIFENRFAAEPKFEKLEVYAAEPGKWDLGSHNRCCLDLTEGNQYRELDQRQLEVLENIRSLWTRRNE